nr:TIGR03750 family conjugal transfer protein [uncultured Halomonas sp.]
MASIEFIPRRINDPPVVFRGMTMREVATVAIAGFSAGLLPGIVLAFLTGEIAMAPTVAVVIAILLLGIGGTIMRRLRRGRPSSLLYRQITYTLAAQGIVLGDERLITRSGVYRTGREPREPGGLR